MGHVNIGGMPSVTVLLIDPNKYLREFQRKPRKIPNSLVDKFDQESNPVPQEILRM